MSHVRNGLMWWGRESKTKITEIDKLRNRALRCTHFKGGSNKSVNNMKIKKKKLEVKYVKVWVRIFMH